MSTSPSKPAAKGGDLAQRTASAEKEKAAHLQRLLEREREARARSRGTILCLKQDAADHEKEAAAAREEAAAAGAREAEYARDEEEERERRWQKEEEDRRLRAALQQKLDRAREAKERSRGTVLRLKQEAAAAREVAATAREEAATAREEAAAARAQEAEYARRFEAPDDKPTKSDTISDGSDDAKPFAEDEARDNDVGAEKVAALQRELRSEREGRRKAEMEVVRLSEEIERIQAEREVNGTPQPRRSPRRIGAKGKGMK